MQRAPTLAAFTSLVPCEKARDAAVEGWDLKAYRKNPVVLFAHDASAWPVGRAVKIGVERDRLVAEVQFANTHEGRKAQHLVETGHLKATSVGFRVLEAKPSTDRERQGGYDFKRQELMEFSIVPVPANPECLICMSAEKRSARNARLSFAPTLQRSRPRAASWTGNTPSWNRSRNTQPCCRRVLCEPNARALRQWTLTNCESI